MTSDAERESDARQIARVRRVTREAGIDYLRERQDEWRPATARRASKKFKKFSRGLLRVERDVDRADRDRDESARSERVDAVLERAAGAARGVRRVRGPLEGMARRAPRGPASTNAARGM